MEQTNKQSKTEQIADLAQRLIEELKAEKTENRMKVAHGTKTGMQLSKISK